MLATNLTNAVIDKLCNRPAWMKFKQIAEDTSIPEGWIKMLAQGKIKEPSGPRLETLYNYLTNQVLKF